MSFRCQFVLILGLMLIPIKLSIEFGGTCQFWFPLNNNKNPIFKKKGNKKPIKQTKKTQKKTPKQKITTKHPTPFFKTARKNVKEELWLFFIQLCSICGGLCGQKNHPLYLSEIQKKDIYLKIILNLIPFFLCQQCI